MRHLLFIVLFFATAFTVSAKPLCHQSANPPVKYLSNTIIAKDTVALNSILPQADSSFKADAELLFKLIERNPTDTLINLISKIIDGLATPDNLFMARAAYNYFINPSYMGQERVGVAIAERYLLGKFNNTIPDEEKYSISSYIKLIKPSLVGNKMPELHLYDIKGKPLDVEKIKGFKILYFYTPTCSSCTVETPRLVEFLKNYKGVKINLIAVISEVPEEDIKKSVQEWRDYTDQWFAIKNTAVEIYNLWDPLLSSSFPLNYGVISTPQLFLIDRKNTILGRALKTPQLKELTEFTVLELFRTYGLLNLFLNGNLNRDKQKATLTYSQGKKSIDNFVELSLSKPEDPSLHYKPREFVTDILLAMIDYLGEDYSLVEEKPVNISQRDRLRLIKYIQKSYSSYLQR